MHFLHQVQQEAVACAVVEPDDAQQVVAATAVLPVVAQELLLRIVQLPLEVTLHHAQHTLVAAVLVVVLQDLQRQHIGPQLAPPVLFLVHRTKVAIGLSALDDGLNPELRLVEQSLLAQHVSHVAVAAKPIGNLLPAVRAAALEPSVAFLVEPIADLAQMTCQAVPLTLQHLAYPSAGSHSACRQLQEYVRTQRRTVVHVILAGSSNGGWSHHLSRLSCSQHGHQHEDCPQKHFHSTHLYLNVIFLTFLVQRYTFSSTSPNFRCNCFSLEKFFCIFPPSKRQRSPKTAFLHSEKYDEKSLLHTVSKTVSLFHCFICKNQNE